MTAPTDVSMEAPRATARLQLHRGFTLTDARARVPYFARLGISHLYVSPITRARPGSMHGYDVVDHRQVNPELGGEEALRSLVAELRRFDMGLIVDIVPNHMATSANNDWWQSVLERGRQSPYAEWFDIDWDPEDAALRGKVVLPFLAQPYGVALESGTIALRHDDDERAFYIDVAGTRYPIAPGSLGEAGTGGSAALAAYDVARPEGRQRLHELLERQHYRLAWWRSAFEEINWRRFFEITELIGMRVERDDVFDAVHAMILRFYEEGLIDGVRVDHVDGLADPIGYCARLRTALRDRAGSRPVAHAGAQPYLVIEKILAEDETLDERWDVDGTTGYDFMSQVGALLHDPDGEAPLTALWEDIAGDARSYEAIAEDARNLMLLRHFPAERLAAARALHRVARMHPMTRDWTLSSIDRTLWRLLSVFPVYRTYAGDRGRQHLDLVYFERAAAAAHSRMRGEHDGDDAPLLDLISAWLGGEAPADAPTAQQLARRTAIRRFQQLTPPLAAKSLEDTAFYRYGRLLSRNDVGANPGLFALPVDAFHRRCGARARLWPHAMLATATHDHKRGEDARARLAVLSEMPAQWGETARDWLRRYVPGAYNGSGAMTPHPADAYMLLQCLVGAWPLGLAPDDEAGLAAFADRVSAWQTKALREAKVHTSWVTPDAGYEAGCESLLRSLLQAGTDADSPARALAGWVARIAPAGAVNSLTQTLLRLTVPGVPDLYQGTEWWDFSLVDPDNRTPVDYAARAAALELPDALTPETLLADWRDGRIKQAVIRGALAARADRPRLFTEGAYVPLPVLGPRAAHVLAFVRCSQGECAFVLAARLCAAHLLPADDVAGAQPRIDPRFWETTSVVLPHRLAGATLHDRLSGRQRQVGADSILPVAEALADFPVCLLE